jgi:hypothetical protein
VETILKLGGFQLLEETLKVLERTLKVGESV